MPENAPLRPYAHICAECTLAHTNVRIILHAPVAFLALSRGGQSKLKQSQSTHAALLPAPSKPTTAKLTVRRMST